MSIQIGNVVGISIGGEAPRAGIVVAQRAAPGNAEPLLDIAVAWLDVHGTHATMGQVNDVPYTDDAPGGHYRWTYSGPEVLVRKALAEPDAGGTASPSPTVDVDPAAGADAANTPSQ